MRQFWLAFVLLASTAALASAARSSARFSAAAAPVAPANAAKTQQAEPEYKYDDYKRSDSYEYDSEEEKAYYSKEPHVINLELLCPDNNNGAATPSATNNTTNLQLGLVCSHKSEYYDTKYEAYGDEDEQPLIKGTPTAMEEIGRGSATIRWLNTQRTVEIEHQRALEVATLSGEFDEFEDAASCDPLLTRKARITFTDVPVYAMVTRVTLPLDSSMLERLLPLSDPGASPPPGNPNIPNIPGLLPGGFLPNNLPSLPSGSNSASIQQATEGNGIVNTGTNTVTRAPAQGARVAVASAATPVDYAYYQDETLCGLTLVAKGPARLRIQGSDRTYAGSMESTLLWTNGLVSLPSFMADAIGASGGRSTQSLFSTTVNQVLSSTVYNGWSDAQLNVLVGNSVSSSAIGPGSAIAQGGTVNITVTENSAIANSDNATVTAGNTLSGNRVNVFNSMGSAIEQYLKLLKTMCKHHKDIPESKPGRVRFDLTPLRAAETAETSGRSGRTA